MPVPKAMKTKLSTPRRESARHANRNATRPAALRGVLDELGNPVSNLCDHTARPGFGAHRTASFLSIFPSVPASTNRTWLAPISTTTLGPESGALPARARIRCRPWTVRLRCGTMARLVAEIYAGRIPLGFRLVWQVSYTCSRVAVETTDFERPVEELEKRLGAEGRLDGNRAPPDQTSAMRHAFPEELEFESARKTRP
jgi:hypothetical protein